MGCFIFLFALISARLAIILTWLFSNVLEKAYDGWLVPVLRLPVPAVDDARLRVDVRLGARRRGASSGSSSASRS